VNGNQIYRPDWRMSLDATQLMFLGHVDGRRTIREIADRVAHDRHLNSTAAREKYARSLFHDLWRLDFFAMAR
jgi:hypothetical protein